MDDLNQLPTLNYDSIQNLSITCYGKFSIAGYWRFIFTISHTMSIKKSPQFGLEIAIDNPRTGGIDLIAASAKSSILVLGTQPGPPQSLVLILAAILIGAQLKESIATNKQTDL